MTPEQIAEARRLVAEATPGPWTFETFYEVATVVNQGNRDIAIAHAVDYLTPENAQLIAASITLIPQLLDALETTEQAAAKQIDEWVKGASQTLIDQRDEARARLAEVERERDEARTTISCQCGDDEACRYVQERDTARAQVATLAETVKWYATCDYSHRTHIDNHAAKDAGERARAALKEAGVEP